MHIGIFAHRDLTLAGGTQVRVVGITKHLKEYGCKTTLFAPNLPPLLNGATEFVALTGDNLRYNRSLYYSAFPKLLGLLRIHHIDRGLAELINSERVDLLHCHSHVSGFRILKIRSKLKMPIIFEPHGILKLQLEDLRREFDTFAFQIPLLLRAERNLFKMIDWVFVRTQREKEFIAREFRIQERKLFVVPDGVDTEFFGKPLQNGERERLRSKIGIKNGIKIVLFAGEFKLPSGLFDLVESIRLLNAKRSDFALVLIGDGVLMAEAKSYVNNHNLSNVVFLGRTPREDFRYYQQLADVVVAPEARTFYNELGVSLKLLECLASGIPTVASDISCQREIVRDGENGYLVEAGNPESFAKGISRALDDPHAKTVGQKGRETMVKEYSWRLATQRAIEAYAKILTLA